MSERERVRRPDPARTHPLRGIPGVFRRPDGTHADPGAGDAAAGPPPASPPFAWPGDDPVSRALRAGCEVVEQAVRRGFGVSGDPTTSSGWAGGRWQAPSSGPSSGSWTTGQWVDAVTGAVTQWVQWVEAWTSMVRASAASAASGPARASLASPPAPADAPAPRTTLQLTVELRTARAVRVELDLTPGAAATFEVHGLLGPAAAAAPPITDVSLTLVDGRVNVALGSIEQHPAGTYAGAILAAGRACGTLTVRLS